jgi:hypothetical protein
VKRFLLALAAVLGITGGVLVVIPQASPFAPVVKVAAEELKAHAEKMPDPCPDAWCARDASGRAGIVGPVNPRDGGPSCECK